jgi:hypothetical protein
VELRGLSPVVAFLGVPGGAVTGTVPLTGVAVAVAF